MATPPPPPSEDAYVGLDGPFIKIAWQRGPVAPARGPTGAQPEDVLAAVYNRLLYLDGRLASAENRAALLHISDAIRTLNLRTARRVAAGVEGTEVAH